MNDALSRVLAAPEHALRFENLGAFARDHLEATRGFTRPIDRAIVGAARVFAIGHAFAGGYRAALFTLVPDLPEDATASLAATEERGAHPRAIETTVAADKDEDGMLTITGKKRWITAPPEKGVILVVARDARAAAGDRPVLKVVKMDAHATGATITPMSDTPFIPEVPHASLVLEGVRVRESDVLPGDGYDQYLKPFRTIEDVHVMAAVLSWLCANGLRAKWPRDFIERAFCAITSARDLAACDPRSPATHIALAGLLAMTESIAKESDAHWALASPDLRAMWERDRVLLSVASKAREQRRAAAWERARTY